MGRHCSTFKLWPANNLIFQINRQGVAYGIFSAKLIGVRSQDRMMSGIRVFRRPPMLLLVVVIGFSSIFLSSCFSELQLPRDAHETLNAYWHSLPSDSRVKYQISRVWSGDTAAEDLASWAPEMEIWCVETEVASSEDLPSIGDRLTWIIFRNNKNEPWSVSLLAVMSSIWPYEACEIGILK